MNNRDATDHATGPADLESSLARLRSQPGPVVVLSKGHSGSRFLASSLEQAGVFIGADQNVSKDSMSWFLHFARPLIASRFFPAWPSYHEEEAFRREVRRRLAVTLPAYRGGVSIDGPWGWKGSTLFVSEVIKEIFPKARFVHLIRDGRDVVLSQDGRLNLPFDHPLRLRRPIQSLGSLLGRLRPNDSRVTEDLYRRRIIFSDDVDWDGLPITRRDLFANRYAVQMQSWVQNVTFAQRLGELWPEDYVEVRYESLCRDPHAEIERVTEFAGLEITPALTDFLETSTRTTSIGKWRSQTMTPERRADFDHAVTVGTPLLSELGYL